jgi:hypothetical protein
LPGSSGESAAILSLVLNFFPLHCRTGLGRTGCPCDDVDDVVSVDGCPFLESEDIWAAVGVEGNGGTTPPGASRPFLVGDACADADRLPFENRPFVFGADATRRRKRLAEAPTALGERGLRVADVDVDVDTACGTTLSLLRPRPRLRCLSALLRFGAGSTIPVGGNVGGMFADVVMTVGGGWDDCLGDMAVPESVDGVAEE